MADAAGDPATGLRPAAFRETVYQCSGCGMTSTRKCKIDVHLDRKNPRACCVGARVLSAAVTLRVGAGSGDAPAPTHVAEAGQVAVAGDHNTTTTTIVNVFAGADDLFEVLRSPDALADIADADPADIPAIVFRYWKGVNAPPAAQTVRADGDVVREARAPGARPVTTSRTKYVRRAVGELFGAVAAAPPAAAPDPAALSEVQARLDQKVFAAGKRRLSHLDAARAYATAAPEYHRLGADGRHFAQRSHATLDTELDALPGSQ